MNYASSKNQKNRLTFLALMGFVFWGNNLALGQTSDTLKKVDSQKQILEEAIESISEDTERSIDFTDLTETLIGYREHPLNLNSATPEQLQQIIFLNDLQIGKLMEYLYTYGSLLTLYELRSIEGWSAETIEKVLPFVTVAPIKQKQKINLKNVFIYGKSNLFIRSSRIVEKQVGYQTVPDSIKTLKPNSYYLGSPYQFYLRYGFNYSDQIKLGIVADKDAGEEFFKGSQRQGSDLYSAFFQLKDQGIIKNIIIGDFQTQFGQGLTLWKGMTFGKSPEAILIKRSPVQFKPNTSANSANFFRGTAFTLSKWGLNLSGFFSNIKRDGNIVAADTLTELDDVLTSLTEGGYHRTNAEISDKNAVKELVFGGNLSYTGRNFSAGITASTMNLDVPLKKSDAIYNQFSFRGKTNQNLGMDFTYLISRYLLFGEISVSKNNGMAVLSGINAYLHSAFQLSLIYRNYANDYQNLICNAFGENSSNSGENGLYTGISAKLAPKLSLSAYADLFSFSWLKSGVDQPSKGVEYSVQTNYAISKTAVVTMRYRFRQKQENEPGFRNTNFASAYSRESFRLNIEYQISQNLKLGNRVELLRINSKNEVNNGVLIFQDVDYDLTSIPLGFSFRFSIFDTDSYDERIYTYENDVLYAFSAPSFYDHGSRTYILIKYNPFRKLDIWLKAAQTSLINKTTSGSGLDQINGPNKTEIKLQIRLNL